MPSYPIGQNATTARDGEVNVANVVKGHVNGSNVSDEAIILPSGAVDLPETDPEPPHRRATAHRRPRRLRRHRRLTMPFTRNALIRAIRTAAQTAIGAIGAATLVAQVDWALVASTVVLATILSLLTSLTGLPEDQGQ